MRDDVLVEEVLEKCDALKRASLWTPEPAIRPRAWLDNFDASDKGAAAVLLDGFTFYNARSTDSLLLSAYHSLGDAMPKGPAAPDRATLLASLETAVFTPVRGEDPNPTDSGNLLIRKVRQLLGVPEDRIVDEHNALLAARTGRCVVFVDDFIGSGDQFLSTWRMAPTGTSFEQQHAANGFIAMYVVLVATSSGMERIHEEVPRLAISAAHVLEERSTLFGLYAARPEFERVIESLLDKYVPRLTPREDFIAGVPAALRYGFRQKGLMLAFEHSVPDATLPIFWSPGTENWRPLLERS